MPCFSPARAVLSALALCAAASSAHAALAPAELSTLQALYASTGGPGWTNQNNWLSGDPCTDGWFGVVCTGGAEQHVQELHLSANNLVGTLPDLSALTSLTKFNVENNSLTGSLSTLATLPALQGFWGNNNQFSGFLPDLPSMTALERIYVNNNQLIGPIPDISGLTNLVDIRVSTNKLTGTPPAAPPNLIAGGSSLCPNYLHAPSPTDAAWSDATGELDWSRWCTPGYLVTASAGPGGSIAPLPGVAVLPNEAPVFTLTPDAGYTVNAVSSTCGGTRTDNEFTTDPVEADCTVSVTFLPLRPVPTLGAGLLAALGLTAAALGLRHLRRA